jgi:hypothetical protein
VSGIHVWLEALVRSSLFCIVLRVIVVELLFLFIGRAITALTSIRNFSKILPSAM